VAFLCVCVAKPPRVRRMMPGMRCRTRVQALLVTVVALAALVVSCTPEATDPTRPFDRFPTATPSAVPTPVPTVPAGPSPTPRPAGPVHSIEDALGWLSDAGIHVEVVTDEQPVRLEGQLQPGAITAGVTMQHVVVREEAALLVYRFGLPVFWQDLVSPFALTGSYTFQTAPTLFIVDNIVFRLRGLAGDVHQALYTAIWDQAPTIHVAAWVQTMPQLRRDEATARAGAWYAEAYADAEGGGPYAARLRERDRRPMEREPHRSHL
jgi:hypothetical protein